MEYVTYDENGSLTGAYIQDLHQNHELCHIPIANDQLMEWANYRANAARDGLELAPAPETSIAAYNAPIFSALLSIDAKTPRAVREALLSGDTTRVQALEAEAAELRLMLRKD